MTNLLRNMVGGLAPIAVVLLLAVGCGEDEQPASDKLYLEAMQAVNLGNEDQALQLLTDSISREPSIWAYQERAKLFAKLGKDAEAKADLEALRALSPKDPQLQWIAGELKKPAGKRFAEKGGQPPPVAK